MLPQFVAIHSGKFLEFRIAGKWEYVARTTGASAVGILAVAGEGPSAKLILISQYRVPVGKVCVEIPAGLVGDGDQQSESWKTAAIRELREETGYTATDMEYLTQGPTSAGLTSECIMLVRALGVQKAGLPQPDSDEKISVHEVPLPNVEAFLRGREAAGELVDPKVWSALYFLKPN